METVTLQKQLKREIGQVMTEVAAELNLPILNTNFDVTVTKRDVTEINSRSRYVHFSQRDAESWHRPIAAKHEAVHLIVDPILHRLTIKSEITEKQAGALTEAIGDLYSMEMTKSRIEPDSELRREFDEVSRERLEEALERSTLKRPIGTSYPDEKHIDAIYMLHGLGLDTTYDGLTSEKVTEVKQKLGDLISGREKLNSRSDKIKYRILSAYENAKDCVTAIPSMILFLVALHQYGKELNSRRKTVY
jgi:hypothetical protein